MATLRERFIVALCQRGAEVVSNHTSTRYAVLTRPRGGFYYVGASGGLRVGACISRSLPVSEKFKAELLAVTAKPKAEATQPKAPIALGGRS